MQEHNLHLLCPGCRAQLPSSSWDEEFDIACASCGATYPYLDGIPLLMPQPSSILLSFRNALTNFCRETNHAQRVVLSQLIQADLSPRARARTRLVSESLPAYRDCILRVFAAANLTPLETTTDPHARSHENEPCAAQNTPVPTILSYYSLIHRDYSWQPDVDEFTPALATLLRVCPADFEFGDTLVLGAGTGRLAWELALRAKSNAKVVALDINPLPLLVTQQLLKGKTLELWELPGHARRSNWAAVKRQLDPPQARPTNLKLIFADALHPPFQDASFDTIVTPWFIDQVPRDISVFLLTIARLLKPGGSWLNQGPLIYDPARTEPAQRYCADEVVELTGRAGFQITTALYESTSYLASPISTQSRNEYVLTFHSTLTRAVVDPEEVFPSWLSQESKQQSVPVMKNIESVRDLHPLILQISTLIDGKKTAHELTEQLVTDGHLADDVGAQAAVFGCLRLLWRASLGLS